MSSTRALVISLALLLVLGFVIACYWYELAQMIIASGILQLEDSIDDQQTVKHWLLLLEGLALCAQNIASAKMSGALWLKIVSGVALLIWILFTMVHLIVGAGVIS